MKMTEKLTVFDVGVAAQNCISENFGAGRSLIDKPTECKQKSNTKRSHSKNSNSTAYNARRSRKTSYGTQIDVSDSRCKIIRRGLELEDRPAIISQQQGKQALKQYIWLIRRNDYSAFSPPGGEFLFLFKRYDGIFFKPTRSIEQKLWLEEVRNIPDGSKNRYKWIDNDGNEHFIPYVSDEWLIYRQNNSDLKRESRKRKREQQKQNQEIDQNPCKRRRTKKSDS